MPVSAERRGAGMPGVPGVPWRIPPLEHRPGGAARCSAVSTAFPCSTARSRAILEVGPGSRACLPGLGLGLGEVHPDPAPGASRASTSGGAGCRSSRRIASRANSPRMASSRDTCSGARARAPPGDRSMMVMRRPLHRVRRRQAGHPHAAAPLLDLLGQLGCRSCPGSPAGLESTSRPASSNGPAAAAAPARRRGSARRRRRGSRGIREHHRYPSQSSYRPRSDRRSLVDDQGRLPGSPSASRARRGNRARPRRRSPHDAALPARRARRPRSRCRRGEQVVDDEHAGAGLERVDVHLELGLAVLELVRDSIGRAGQLAGLAHRDEARVERAREGAAEDEAARLDAHHRVDALADERCASRSSAMWSARGSARSGVMSLKRMPGLGKSLMSRILARSSATSISTSPPSGTGDVTHRDGRGAARGLGPRSARGTDAAPTSAPPDEPPLRTAGGRRSGARPRRRSAAVWFVGARGSL